MIVMCKLAKDCLPFVNFILHSLGKHYKIFSEATVLQFRKTYALENHKNNIKLCSESCLRICGKSHINSKAPKSMGNRQYLSDINCIHVYFDLD